MKVLEVKNLEVSFEGKKAVDSLSFEICSGEIVGLVGESGCGKSLTAFSILGMSPPGSKLSGEVIYSGVDLLSLNEENKRKIRGNKIALIPQDPLSALNPVFTVGDQIIEVLEVHKNHSYKEASLVATNTLESVNVPNANLRLKDYPHQFSGGMRQRVLIAMALAPEPEILIADEPTTALDVTIQMQVLELIKNLKNKGKSILLITHDLAVVSEICDRVYVMYAGKIVESGLTSRIFLNPKHPYTIGLINSLPKGNQEKLIPIPGSPPSIDSIPEGCAFHPRCPHVMERCKKEVPELYEIEDVKEHKSRCFLEISALPNVQ